MSATDPFVAITHCHTRQSNNEASAIDELIRAAVHRVVGRPAPEFDWAESLTTPRQIAQLLNRPRGDRRVDFVFVTDHINEKAHALDGELVDLATTEPRLAIGGELQTVVEDPPGSGRLVSAPEVLVYGRADRVRSRGGWHYGVNDELLADLHRSCRAAGSQRVELHAVLAYCRQEKIAHALSHPLDGHCCSAEATLRALAACRFIEAVNGGFSGSSTARLLRYAGLHNELTLHGAAAAVDEPAVSPDENSRCAAWLISHLAEGRRRGPEAREYVAPGMIAFGGSDAHTGDYDRVLVEYRPRASRGHATVADFVADMVDTPTSALLQERVFAIRGRTASLARCLNEVLRLVHRNAVRNRATFRGTRSTARLAVLGPYLAVKKVLEYRAHQRRLGMRLDHIFAAAECRVARHVLPPVRRPLLGAESALPTPAATSRSS